ncbi:MAG: hypothetical protein IJN25_07160 [Clostridia bacterium]|nr:hypothetical protein [Oscillospiraceae bacterium]MBQ7033418.1 hypothetical protein [Clostridia bacterium]
MDIRHDLHLRTTADPETLAFFAKEKGLTTVGIADPVWDTAVSPAICDFYEGQTMDKILSATLPKEKGLRVLRGCEAEMDKNGVLGLSEKAAKELDFVLACHSNSQHGAVIDSAVRSDIKKLAEVLCDRFSLLVENPMAKYITAITRPFFPAGNPDNFDEVLFRIPDDRLEDLFSDANYHKIAIEINASAFRFFPIKAMHRSEMFRIYETAKECGCKFIFGTDCETSADYPESLERLYVLANLLEITEDDLCPLVLK